MVKGETLSTLLVLIANAVRHSERLREGRRTIVRLREAREKVRELYQVLLDLTASLFDTIDL